MTYCILGPLLLFTESKLYGSDAMRQALPITLLAIFFFAYNLASLAIFRKLLYSGSKSITIFYLTSKLMRLLLCMVIFIGYGILVRSSLLLFAVNLVVFYIVSILTNSIYCIREENIIKKKK